jgi:amidohydrolase
MIKDGCMEGPAVGAVLAFHVAPYLPTGTIEFCRGKMNAATCDLNIEVEGVSCHGAHPEGGIDAIVVGSQIVTALQSIISRNLSPTNAGIITVGQFHAGVKDNVVAGSAKLTGTIRALDPVTMNTLKTRVTTTAEGICAGYGAKAHVTLVDGYPALINGDEIGAEMEALAEEHIGRENIVFMAEPSLGADDFAFFTQMCDGVYMNVGTNSGKEEHPQNIHNEWYNPDEEAMKNGMLMEVLGALKLLAK